MKKILVPLATRRDEENTFSPMHYFRETYIKKLITYGLLPLFVSTTMDQDMISEVYTMCDGAYFMGGTDFSAAAYGEKNHPATKADDPQRDELEISLLKQILLDKKPFLGICRGCEALAIASGGNLYQHLADEYPQENHVLSPLYSDYENGQKHRVVLDKKSKAYTLLGKEKITVLSGHHQAVHNSGKDIRISAASPAGVAEIIEHTDPNYFCYGIISHPEAEAHGDLEIFFSAFANAVNTYKK